MHAEVIAIGDELTSGQRLDTNSQWISQQLGELGIQTVRHTTVGDDLESNIDALRNAVRRADVVICSGGLGPTLDDLTRQAIADAFGLELVQDENSLAHIQAMFANRKREMPERNRVQAMFPEGTHVIPNPHGSAPGIDLLVDWQPSPTGSDGATGAARPAERSTSRVIALPGVPAELREMWTQTVVGRLESMLGSGNGPLRYYALKIFGIGESDVEVKLPDLIDRNRTPTVGITVSRATITLRIASRARSEDEFREVISPTIEEIQQALGDLVFGEGDEELEDVVLRKLQSRGESIACVEVGAASLLSDWLLQASVAASQLGTARHTASTPLQDQSNSASHDQPEPEAATSFAGGIAFPALLQAERWLDASSSPQGIWSQLAIQARTRFASDIGLAVGVYPSLAEMESTNTAFEFHFAIAYRDHVHHEKRSMGGHPDVLGPRVAKTGLDLVRKLLR